MAVGGRLAIENQPSTKLVESFTVACLDEGSIPSGSTFINTEADRSLTISEVGLLFVSLPLFNFIIMRIRQNAVAEIHYTLKNDDGQVLDSSEGREPLAYIQGLGNLIPGLETALEGLEAGDKINAVIEPEDAYGHRTDEYIYKVPKANFKAQDGETLQVGMQVQVETSQGPAIALVTDIQGDEVTLDMNHPLADMRLHFDVEVVSVREATAEEIDHGHVHGPGGHQH